MKRKITSLITAVIIMLTFISVPANAGTEQHSVDLTTLTASNYNADGYTAVNDTLSIKAKPEYVTSDGVKVSKKNNVRIKFEPTVDGELTVTCVGSVILTDYENRKGGEENIKSDTTTIAVTAGTVYYLQGSASSAAAIKAIYFKEKAFELFSVTGVGFSKDYTKILEFDIEKGDDYEHDITACICVYAPNGALKKAGIKKIRSNSLVIGKNTVKCDINITGYDKNNDTLKILLLSGLE